MTGLALGHGKQRPTSLRTLVLLASACIVACSGPQAEDQAPVKLPQDAGLPPFASVGAKVGEVEATTALVHTYLLDRSAQELLEQPYEERQYRGKPGEVCVEYSTSELADSVPGILSEAEFARYRRKKSDSLFTSWFRVPQDFSSVSNPDSPLEEKELQQARMTDYSVHLRLNSLRPSTGYYFRLWIKATGAEAVRAGPTQQFQTAPHAEALADVSFIATTCFHHGKMKDLAEGTWPVRGFRMHQALLDLRAKDQLHFDFAVVNGDTVYLDKQGLNYRSRPDFETAGIRARYLDTYLLPLSQEFFGQVPVYFLKDDHDWRFNDADPVFNPAAAPRRVYWRIGKYYRGPPGPFLGKKIFEEMHPVQRGPEARPYRTFRWGRGLQIWLLEARECRYPNTRKLERYGLKGLISPQADSGSSYLYYPYYCGIPSSEDLWGPKQFAWLMDSLKNSDAFFKVIISPTPVLGPDQPFYLAAARRPLEQKADNHVIRFRAEFSRFVEALRREELNNVYIVSGDRHFVWHSRYQARDGKFTLHEFGSGPFTDDIVSFGDRLYSDEKGAATVVASEPRAGFLHVQVSNVATRPSIKIEWYLMENWKKRVLRRWKHAFEAEPVPTEKPSTPATLSDTP